VQAWRLAYGGLLCWLHTCIVLGPCTCQMLVGLANKDAGMCSASHTVCLYAAMPLPPSTSSSFSSLRKLLCVCLCGTCHHSSLHRVGHPRTYLCCAGKSYLTSSTHVCMHVQRLTWYVCMPPHMRRCCTALVDSRGWWGVSLCLPVALC